ncbi:FtsX-like permease family protein [Clostridium paraputrificum]|uniref:FtsX-like permease family protein n=1 Tax=Clostridium TaxID=1485 RepID=UPI003D348997
MGIINFAKKMSKVDLKKSKSYIAFIGVTAAFMLNAINISYNEYIYGSRDIVEKSVNNVGNVVQGGTEFFDLRPVLFQKQNIFMLLLVVIIFSTFCNLYYIQKKKKEMAFCLINGASLIDLTKYLLWVNGVNYIAGTLLGLVLGIILIPAFNFFMYSLSGVQGNLFSFSIDTIGITFAFIFIQFVCLVALGFGSTYRHQLIDLIKGQKTVTIKDNRTVKVPGLLFFILYLLPIFYGIKAKGSQGDDIALYYLGFVGLVGILGTISYFIPKLINKIKDKTFMYKGARRIYVSNFMYSLHNAKMYFFGLGFSLLYFAYTIERYSYRPGVLQNGIFCFVGSSLIIGLTLAYKLSVEIEEKKVLYKQLKILGYTREEISDAINKEYILFFGIGLLMPFLIILVTILTYIKLGTFTISFAVAIFASYTIPLALGGIIATVSNKRKILNWIYGGM